MDIWHALIHGELSPSKKSGGDAELLVNLRFRDQQKVQRQRFLVPKCYLNNLSFEIRVYALFGRQPAAIAVSNAREYVNQHGGIKIYDSGFRLPYYGLEHDWLDIEVDHSHRKSESQFLPDAFQVPGGLSNVPTQTRLLGYVYVNTGKRHPPRGRVMITCKFRYNSRSSSRTILRTKISAVACAWPSIGTP